MLSDNVYHRHDAQQRQPAGFHTAPLVKVTLGIKMLKTHSHSHSQIADNPYYIERKISWCTLQLQITTKSIKVLRGMIPRHYGHYPQSNLQRFRSNLGSNTNRWAAPVRAHARHAIDRVPRFMVADMSKLMASLIGGLQIPGTAYEVVPFSIGGDVHYAISKALQMRSFSNSEGFPWAVINDPTAFKSKGQCCRLHPL